MPATNLIDGAAATAVGGVDPVAVARQQRVAIGQQVGDRVGPVADQLLFLGGVASPALSPL